MKKYNFLILQREKELNMTQNQSRMEKSQVLKNARWEHLYKMELNKQHKLKKLREENEHINEQKTMRECTFSPQLNKLSLKEDRSLLERNDQWASKRESKINHLQQQDFQKEQELYTFSPKLNDNYRADTETAEKVILNSYSYMNFVERNRKGKSSSSVNRYKTESVSETSWKTQLTSPKKHPLFSDKQAESSTCLTVKSLRKPLNPEKFSMIKSFSRNKLLSPSNANKKIDCDKVIFNNKKLTNVQSLYENQKQAMTLNKPTYYNDAIKLLHDELHTY